MAHPLVEHQEKEAEDPDAKIAVDIVINTTVEGGMGKEGGEQDQDQTDRGIHNMWHVLMGVQQICWIMSFK